jgi:SNF2 family DNA or RNA helicase
MTRREFLENLKLSRGRELLLHQINQAIFHVERKRSINASETGTGKFLVALAMRKLIEHETGHTVRCIYTSPKSALGQFQQEFQEHGYRPFALRHGKEVIPADADTVQVANSTMIVTHRGQLRDYAAEIAVLDEAHAFKSAGAARTRAVYGDYLNGTNGIIEGVPYVLAMSGTMAPSSNAELFPHLRALAPETIRDERGRVMRRHTFESKFCVFGPRRTPGGREVSVIVGSRNSELLGGLIAPYVARVDLREIAPDLPPERHEFVPIDRADIDLNELADVENIEDPRIRAEVEKLMTAITSHLVPESEIDRLVTQLMQAIGSGTALAHLRRAFGVSKTPFAEDAVLSHRGGIGRKRAPTLIFVTYRMTGDRLEARLDGQGVVTGRIHGDTPVAERAAVIAGIQDNTIEAAILQIEAAGSALNLQAANKIVMLEPSWTPGTNQQAVARAVRIGQANPVLVSWPYVRNSIDEAVMRVLRKKQAGLTDLWRAAS